MPEQRWPREGWFSKCTAGAIAGAVTGALAGTGVVIALVKEIELDPRGLEYLLGGVIVLLATIGGMLTGAIASGCYVNKPEAK